VIVEDVHTGKALVTVALPAVDVAVGVSEVAGVSAAGDDRTFVVGRRNGDSAITYFLVHIAPGTKQVATVEQLPVPQGNPDALLDFAVSPDGKELAVMSVRGNGTTLRIYSVKSGATLRTWVAGTWRTVDSEYLEGVDVSWTADSRHVAFATVLSAGQNSLVSALEERVIAATVPSGDLATASKVVLKAPSNCLSLLLTPDGGTVVCGTQVNPPGTPLAGDCGKNGPMFVAYSAATGTRLRVLYQHTGPCRSGVITVLWSDDSARHVIGETLTTFQGNPPPYAYRYGVAAEGKFTNFAVAQQGQSSSGPAF
jgi:WD40 repeat protein